MKCVTRGIFILAIILSAGLTSLWAEPALSISSESPSGINLSFELPDWTVETESISTGSKISIKDASYLFVDDQETLPVFSTFIAIPYQGGVELETRPVKRDSRQNIDWVSELCWSPGAAPVISIPGRLCRSRSL